VNDAVQKLKKGDDFRMIAEDGLRAASTRRSPDRSHRSARVDHDVLQRSVDTVNSRLQSGMSFLATAGSVSPFVGLFGTVWVSITPSSRSVSRQASIDALPARR